jgi:hypothetical protein
MLKKGDVILLLIAVFGLLTVLLLGRGSADSSTSVNSNMTKGEQLVAVVKKDDEIIREINLTGLRNQQVIKVHSLYDATIVAENKRIRFMESGCPDKICVNAGWLNRPGDVAVCLPNKIIIKLETVKNSPKHKMEEELK